MVSFFFFRFRVSASLSGVVEVGTRRGEDSSSKKFAVEPRFEFFLYMCESSLFELLILCLGFRANLNFFIATSDVNNKILNLSSS